MKEKVPEVISIAIFEAYEQTYEKSHRSICFVPYCIRWTDFDSAQSPIQP
jgi:hypothetical protein